MTLMLAAIVQSANLSETAVEVAVRLAGLAGLDLAPGIDVDALGDLGFTVTTPIRMVRRGGELRLVLQGAAAPARRPNPQLLRELISARVRVADYIGSRGATSISELARREGIDVADASRSMQLAFLAPDLVERILDGEEPEGLTATQLKTIGELPLLWAEQRQLLG